MEDFIQSFELQSSNIRGRIFRSFSVVNEILSAHSYPEEVSRLTAEAMTLCALLSSMLKFEGIFTFQIQGDGPVSMLVADMTSDGSIRGCSAFNREKLETAVYNAPAELLGKGYLAFTVDQGQYADRYQGIVEMKGDSLIATVQHYFTQSEQIATGLIIHIEKQESAWVASGIMLQYVPEQADTHSLDKSNVDEDDWRRAMILLGSITQPEMLSKELTSEDILFRLFHEEGVLVYDKKELTHKCRCDNERVHNVLLSMKPDDLEDMTVNGEIVMTCEFCSRDYVFNPVDIKKEIEARKGT